MNPFNFPNRLPGPEMMKYLSDEEKQRVEEIRAALAAAPESQAEQLERRRQLLNEVRESRKRIKELTDAEASEIISNPDLYQS